MNDDAVNDVLSDAVMDTVDGAPVLRFERRLAHAPAKVWRAVTEPAELAHWFPAAVEFSSTVDDPRPGAAMRFVFGEDAPIDDAGAGEVLEFDPPKVFAFRWNVDVLRFEIVPDGEGCRLLFSQTLGGGRFARLSGGRNAAGWDVCLAALTARLDGATAQPPTDWLTPMERYAERFGLDVGTVTETDGGYEIHFARDLIWKPLPELWALLIDGADLSDTPPPRATNGYVQPGALTEASAPDTLAYAWCVDGAAVGTVRWTFTADPALGHRVELTQTVPAAHAADLPTFLAAWHVQLELFFAATFGVIRCPWPTERTDALTTRYAESAGDSAEPVA